MTANDLDLLHAFARDQSQDAFTALVQRQLDLVYCAALRQVRSPQLAEEVAQSVFTDLARNATQLKSDTVLTAWLYQVTRRTAIDVVRRESRRQLREQIAIEMNAMNANADDWTQVEPLLDEAMHALDETDRAAVLLRYFENKSLREVGETLGTTDDAARKRVARAVERLREFFAKHGVNIGASGLVVVISANAVLTAPAGLSAAIAATALAGTTLITTATATVTKAIAMTTLQKALIAVAVVVATGMGIYEVQRASRFRDEIQTLQQQQSSFATQLAEIALARDNATRQLAAMREENQRLTLDGQELPRLRNEVGLLGAQVNTNNLREKALREDNPILFLVDLFERTHSHGVRNDVVLALGSIGPDAKEAIPALLRGLEDPSIDLRMNAARALGAIHSDSELVVPALLKFLVASKTFEYERSSDQESHLKQNVSYALADFGADAKGAIPRLIELLQDRDKGVRWDAEKALKRIDAEAASKALNDLGPAIEQLNRADAEAASKVEIK